MNNGTIMCMWHAWRFNLRDGACVNVPKARRRCPPFPLTVQGDDLFVTLPADSEAPPSS